MVRNFALIDDEVKIVFGAHTKWKNKAAFFSPFYFASPEMIEVKIGNRLTDRQTGRQIL